MNKDQRNNTQRDERNRDATEQELAETFAENPEGLAILAALLSKDQK